MRRLLFTATTLLLSANAAALELESILERAMVTPPARVGFQEERHNALFEEPLRLTGYLEYLEDGELRKVIETPFAEAFHVRSDHVEIERDGETQVLPIRKSRSLKVMLGGIEAILAGDTERIGKVFVHELSGTESDWSMRLTPRSKRVARQLTALTVTGGGDAVTGIRFDLGNGEWHQMELLPDPTEQ
ncbi:MAG: hypothetical protein OES93_15050 [Gammaproteobacteria bacterium]|nr:hypothetical protein [Gammaproteobacteria bacterium]MDH3759168.1 hypothetical protein [Gammaproteobacteria bacterium]